MEYIVVTSEVITIVGYGIPSKLLGFIKLWDI